METKWEGLWEQGHEGMYASKTIKKADIPEHTRILVIRNKYYEKGGDRPKFVYCFSDQEDYKDRCIPLEEKETLYSKINELAEVMRRGNANGDIVALPSESQAIAKSLLNQAISIVEDITGEKWDFSFITF